MDSGSGCDGCAVIEMIGWGWVGILMDGYYALFHVYYMSSYQ